MNMAMNTAMNMAEIDKIREFIKKEFPHKTQKEREDLLIIAAMSFKEAA